MSPKTLAYSAARPSTSRVVLLGAGLAVASVLTLLAAPVGYRLGVLPLRIALLTVLRWGAYGGAAAAVVSLIGLGVTLMRPKDRRRGVGLAVTALVLGVALVGFPGRFRFGPPRPPIHDITTDTQQPPQYVAVLPLRANAPNPTVYGGERIAASQRAAYPDVQPLVLEIAPARAFERALATVRAMGWDLVEADAATGRIEATDTTFWFGFKDDVIVRIRPTAAGGSRIDVRSLSRASAAGTSGRTPSGFSRSWKRSELDDQEALSTLLSLSRSARQECRSTAPAMTGFHHRSGTARRALLDVRHECRCLRHASTDVSISLIVTSPRSCLTYDQFFQ